MDSLAILERGDFSDSTASLLGREAQCPFCRGRGLPSPEIGATIMVLNDFDSGSQYIVAEKAAGYGHGILTKAKNGSNKPDRIIRPDLELFIIVSELTVPTWLPPLPLRYAFIVDELAVWFCRRGLLGSQFHWRVADIAELVRVCWAKRLPISASEMSAVLIAHGLPGSRQDEFERMFEFGIQCLVEARSRPALKKLRQQYAIFDCFADALRFDR